MAKQKLPKVKGVTRIDDPGGHGVGWYARVRYRGKTWSKYFADMSHKGTMGAFRKAVDWRNDKEKEIGKPRTDRMVVGQKARGGNKVTGVHQARNSFVVAWSPKPGVVIRKFVSIAKYGKKKAFEKAVELRQKGERAIYGRAINRKR